MITKKFPAIEMRRKFRSYYQLTRVSIKKQGWAESTQKQSNLLNNVISESQLTSTANLRDHQVLKSGYQKGLHFQDHCPNTTTTTTTKNYLFTTWTNIHKTTGKDDLSTYMRVTLLSLLHVTWNHSQGLTLVAFQLWKTLLGSFKLLFNAIRVSPVLKGSTIQFQTSLIVFSNMNLDFR